MFDGKWLAVDRVPFGAEKGDCSARVVPCELAAQRRV